MIPTDRPDTSSVLYASPIRRSRAISRKAEPLCKTIRPKPVNAVGRGSSPGLSSFLHDSRDLLYEHLRGRVLPIHLPVSLRDLASLRDKDPEVGSHPRVDETDIRAYGGDFLDDGGVDEEGGGFLLGG